MPVSFDKLNNAFLSDTDIFYKYLSWFLSIFVKDLEIISEIVEDLAIRAVAINRYEVNFIRMAVGIKFSQLFMGPLGCDDESIVGKVGKIVRMVIELSHFDIVVEFLQFIERTF